MTRRSGHRRLRDYRSYDPSAGVWWKPGADPVGPHSIAAFIIAIALVAIVGVAFDPLGITTEFDLSEVELAAFDEGYEAVYEEGRISGSEQSRSTTLIALALEHPDRSAPWTQGVRQGWADGWNEALDALMAATEAQAPSDERQRELTLLVEIIRR